MSDEYLPLRGGCWVRRGSGTNVQIARVKSCYAMEGKIYLDLYMYSHKGENIGRISPVEGGPRSFEPACELIDWWRIEKPTFPLNFIWIANENGTASPGIELKTIPFGRYKIYNKPLLKAVPIAGVKSDFDPLLEAFSRRMAAQELRDLAKSLPHEAASLMRSRASVLEQEAENINPRIGLKQLDIPLKQ